MRTRSRALRATSSFVVLLAACTPTARDRADAAGEPDAGVDVDALLLDAPTTDDARRPEAPDAPGQDAPGSGRSCRTFCAAGSAAPGAPTTPRLETFVVDVAAATCAAAFRCCDAADRDVIFAPIRNDGADEWSLAAFRSRLPPEDADFTEAECRAVLAEAYAIRPFGSWISEVSAGRVEFVADAYASCLEALETASCGDEMAAALTDSTCFAFVPPVGGETQRRMFRREGQPGDPCRRLEDGVGAGLYGTCDPLRAFCCFDRPDVGSSCWLPSTPDAVGTCRAVAATGESCNFSPRSFQLCATGSDCGDEGTCEAPASSLPVVAEGQRCFEDLRFVANCGPDASCDVLGTGTCVGLRELGEACEDPSVCRSGVCR
jgi:hypothetical protein